MTCNIVHIGTKHRSRRILIAFAVILGVMWLPALASAAPTWTNTAASCAGGAGGEFDQERVTYIACGTSIGIKLPNGAFRTIPAGVGLSDIAPSPDGKYIYATDYATVFRLNRVGASAAAATRYEKDATWKPAALRNANGTTTEVKAGYLTTDWYGNLYLAWGTWARPERNVIYKYAPNGTLITAFGDYTQGWELGKFHVLGGVAVTRDGSAVFTTEIHNQRVTRWELQPNKTYRPVKEFGNTHGNSTRPAELRHWMEDIDPNSDPRNSAIDRVYARQANWCAEGGHLGGSYDIASDAWDRLYVASTSCQKVSVFDQNGTWLADHSVAGGARNHRISIDAVGGFYTPENRLYSRPNDAAWSNRPWPQLPTRKVVACPDKSWVPGVQGPNGAGQAGENGQVVIACKTDLAILNTAGRLTGRVALPTGARYYDAAPSPDWSSIYVTRVTNYSATRGRSGNPEIVRFRRTGAAGTLAYTLDTTWRPANFTLGGRQWTIRSRYIATDSYGDLYASSGGWAGYYTDANDSAYVPEVAPGAIIKLAPTGALLTSFHSADAAIGEFDVNMGVTVSRDGSSIWTIEHTRGRVQRFNRQLNGSYASAGASAIMGTPDRTCALSGGLSVPYDLGVDPWGNVFVANTGCRQIVKFRADGTRAWTKAVPEQPHGIAVGRQGEVYVAAADVAVTPDDAPGPVPVLPEKPVPDNTAPTLSAIDVADPSPTATPTVTLTATDNVAITSMRIANENQDIWAAEWHPYTRSFTHQLTPNEGTKGFWVQLRDEAGNTSQIRYRTTTLTFPNDAPQLHSVGVEASVLTNTVTLAIDASDDYAVTEVRVANENETLSDSPWTAYEASLRHVLSPGLGSKGVFVQVRDAKTLESEILFVRTTVIAPITDSEPPAGPVIPTPVNGGPLPGVVTTPAIKNAAPVLRKVTTVRKTNSRSVKLRINASDDHKVVLIRIANESESLSKAKWRPYSASYTHKLSKGKGFKGFWVQVADASGATSNIRYLRVTRL